MNHRRGGIPIEYRPSNLESVYDPLNVNQRQLLARHSRFCLLTIIPAPEGVHGNDG